MIVKPTILKMLASVMAVNQKWLKTEIPYYRRDTVNLGTLF